jgi:chemotaxis protein CheD
MIINVGIGEVAVCHQPEDVLRMTGLGSCAGVFLIARGRWAAAAHVLVPQSSSPSDSPGKGADRAIPHLIGLAEADGIPRFRLEAVVVGGAHLFSFSGNRPELDVGARNTQAVLDLIGQSRIKVKSTHIGGNCARTVNVEVGNGAVSVTETPSRLARNS